MTASPEPSRLFRPGRPDDATAIRSILIESNLSAPAPGDLGRFTHSRIGAIRIFVCELDHELIAVLQWRHLGEEAEILDVAVRPAHRHCGHASFLLLNFLQQAAASSVQKIFLEVRESNSAAIAFYKKFGFQSMGRRPSYYRNPDESALLMSLSLPA
jgi:[ribosomal protein S18]-alanine N-acetyltransferase